VTGRLFAPQALRELRQASVWIAKDNRGAADALLAAALRAAQQLAEKPQLGRVRLDLAPERFRFWALRGFPYLLVYDAEVQPARIIRIVHMARDLPVVLRDLDH